MGENVIIWASPIGAFDEAKWPDYNIGLQAARGPIIGVGCRQLVY
jgi:hypothetical protein